MSTWFDRITRTAILFLIFFTPFVFGSVHPWAFALIETVIFLLVALWMIQIIAVRREALGVSRASYPLRLTPFALPLALFIALVLLQLVPLPPALLHVLSPATYQLYEKSLPGWPAKIPYEDLADWQQGSAQFEDRAWMLLPTPQEVDKGARVPFMPGARSMEQGAGSREQRAAHNSVGHQTSEVRGQKAESGEQSAKAKEQRAKGNEQGGDSLPSKSLWLPLSLAPSLSQADLLKLAAYSGLFFLVLLYPFNGPRLSGWSGENSHEETNFLRAVLAAILMTGLLVAIIGIAQAFTWNGKILWIFEPYDWKVSGPGQEISGPGEIPRASGPFVNPDNFGNYLALILFLSMAGVFFPSFIPARGTEQGFRIFCTATGLLIISAILLSLSRGAWISVLAGSSFFAYSFLRMPEERRPQVTRRSTRNRSRIFAIAFCLTFVLVFFLIGTEGRGLVEGRLSDVAASGNDLRGRVEMSLASLRMFWDFPLLGVGLGSWPDLFPRYRSAPWFPVFFREAHNDYVELLAETGILGFGVLSFFFWQCGRVLLSQLPAISPKVFPAYVAILSGLVAMAIHELMDFSLQIPANALLFTLLLALGLRMALREEGAKRMEQGAWSREPGAGTEQGVGGMGQGAGERPEARGRKSEAGHSHAAIRNPKFFPLSLRSMLHAPRSLPLGVCLLCVVLIFAALGQEMTPYPYNLRAPVSTAEAKDMIFAHPARAAGHYNLFQQAELRAPRSWLARELEIAVWLAPTNPHARDLYAALLLQQRRRKEGLEEISRSVFYSPSFQTHAYLNPRILHWLSPDELSAVENGFQQAIAQGFPDALGHLVAFYESLHRYLDAAKLYETEAVKTNAPNGKSILLLKAGYFYAMGQDEKKADALLRERVAVNPSDPIPYQYLASLVYVPNNNFIAARAVIAEGIRNGADPGTLYVSLADAAAKIGNRSEENSALVEAIKFKPSSHSLHYRLGILALRENNFDRAAFYLAQTARLNPQSAEAVFHLAMAEEGRYRFFAAEKAYLRAVELAPQQIHYRDRYEAFKRKISDNQKSGMALSN